MSEADDTSEHSESDTSDEPTYTYVPILREGRHERNTMGRLGGLTRFTSLRDGNRLVPLLEITSEDDFAELGEYVQAGDELLVDLPRYLTERDNSERGDVVELLDEYDDDPAEFFSEHSSEIPVPVISGSIDDRNYDGYEEVYRELEDEFDKIALRLFVPANESLSDEQKENIDDLAELVTNDEMMLFDVVNIANREDHLLDNLEYLVDAFEETETVVLNGFDVYDGETHNFGPVVTVEVGADGFGDYAINARFPQDAIIAHDTRTIKHYLPGGYEAHEFKGTGFNRDDGAYSDLESWDEWDPTHCNSCERAERTTNEDWGTWKEIRMGHYIRSVLGTDLEEMTVSDPADLDEDGHEALGD